MRLLKEGLSPLRLEPYTEEPAKNPFDQPGIDRVHQENVRELERHFELHGVAAGPHVKHPRPRGG